MWQIRKPVQEEAESKKLKKRALEEHRLVAIGEAGAFAKRDKNTELKVELHQRLLDLINLQALDKMSRAQIADEVGDIVVEELAKQNEALNSAERKQLVDDILDELLGLGPIEPLLKDPTITDILVNGYNQVFVERFGVLEPSAVRFKDEKHLLRIIQKIVSAVGRRVDESSPMVDARLADGSRVNAIVPPLAIDGSLLSIRKFARVPISMERLVDIGSIPLAMAEMLQAVVKARRYVIISGGTGSGKTTLLNTLSSFIQPDHRVITIEDAAELQLQQEHVVRLETRPPNIEGRGAVTATDLVKNALRMRPDRIVVGEVRGGEALDMLQAMNTGHDGSLTTLHANTPRDALSRLETMVLMSGMELPVRAIREQIASAVHLVVQQQRFADGSRKVCAISEVSGMETDVITMQDIFLFKQEGFRADGSVAGRFVATGFVPSFYDDLQRRGIPVDMTIFREEG